MGNDVNDLPCLSCVAFPIVVKDAHPDVISVARYTTKLPGGQGAVREVCDLFEKYHPGVQGSEIQGSRQV
jgi:3-deoxy-D-manno-octulosonate 8-phosphate phosphatase KdsC-like HAD superfamily phosphatase